MPKLPLPTEVADLLGRPNPAVIATLRADGQPVSVATWYLLEGDRILVNMDARRRRLSNLRNDPRVALTVLDEDDWSTHVSIRGWVVEIAEDDRLAGIDRLARHYTGRPFRNRKYPRVNAWIDIDRWTAWDLPAAHSR
jgi:PPOX class probable F420-dependent enzyme